MENKNQLRENILCVNAANEFEINGQNAQDFNSQLASP